MPTIAIVDGNVQSREQLGTTLVSHGYATYGFSDAQAALDGLAEVDPDLIVVDMAMQDPSGFEFLVGQYRHFHRPDLRRRPVRRLKTQTVKAPESFNL